MQMIIQHEWYKEYNKVISKQRTRNPEQDAVGADQTAEKIYE
jgi:hypothetical protein